MTYITYFFELFLLHAAWPVALIISTRSISNAVVSCFYRDRGHR